jgi:hypothetical protein
MNLVSDYPGYVFPYSSVSLSVINDKLTICANNGTGTAQPNAGIYVYDGYSFSLFFNAPPNNTIRSLCYVPGKYYLSVVIQDQAPTVHTYIYNDSMELIGETAANNLIAGQTDLFRFDDDDIKTYFYSDYICMVLEKVEERECTFINKQSESCMEINLTIRQLTS